MAQAKLKVTLLDTTRNAVALIYSACRQCYSAHSAAEIFRSKKESRKQREEFIRKVVASGHESPLEHVKFTFAVEGVSRALTHQLVRHRIASFCLTGDTIIKGARQKSKNYKKFTLKSLYERTLTPQGKSRLKLIMLNSFDEKKQEFTRGKIENVVYTGKQMVWEVLLANGQSVKATLNHKFFTKDGWLTLGEIINCKPELGVNGVTCRYPNLIFLRDKDWLYNCYNRENRTQEEIAEELGCSKHTVRAWIRKHGFQKETGGLHGRPSPRGYHWKLKRRRTLEEKIAASERMKGENNHRWRGGITREAVTLRKEISAETRKAIYKRDGYRCKLCYNIGGRLTLHHKIPIYVNKQMAKDANNLITLCQSCHREVNNHEHEYANIFGTEGIPYHSRSNGCYRTIKWVGIESINYHGVEETYDIVMQEPYHNFVANGFVVHNSQQSQRYVKETDFDFIIPPSIEKDMMMKTEFLRMMKEIQESYTHMLECFKQKGKTGEKANEDARFLLPQAAETKIVVTMNCRELLHFFRVRCCSRAQWEIRKLADAMLAICKKQLGCVFDDAGAKCVALEFCPEGEKFSCGRYPVKEKVMKIKG